MRNHIFYETLAIALAILYTVYGYTHRVHKSIHTKGANTVKVEIISNTQVRVDFMAQDLAARDISIKDFIRAPGNKTQGLFREITSILQEEYNFVAIGTPLVFEATMSHDTLSILVTKMADDAYGNPPDNNDKRAQFQNILGDIMTKIKEIHGDEMELVSANISDGVSNTKIPINPINNGQTCGRQAPTPPSRPDSGYTVFSFDDFDMMAQAAAHIPKNYKGRSHAFKLNDKRYLVLQNVGTADYCTKSFEAPLAEFGQKQPTCSLTYHHMLEHGEVIIAEEAITKLQAYHNA